MTMADTVLITGNTFPVKDQIKAMGGRWDADAKGWRVPADKAEAARTLVASGGSTGSDRGGRPYRPSRCKECGVNAASLRAPYEKILRNGLCTGCNRDRRDGYGD
jgi:hypothetical protein